MASKNTIRGWLALAAGIGGGYAALGTLFWLDDERMMVAAMGLSLVGLGLGMVEMRRRRCAAGPGAAG